MRNFFKSIIPIALSAVVGFLTGAIYTLVRKVTGSDTDTNDPIEETQVIEEPEEVVEVTEE